MNQAFQLSRVVQRHQNEVVLSIDNYAFERNKVTALIGPNGSGKSTLLDMLSFIRTPEKGTIRYLDENEGLENNALYRQEIGYVQQRPYLFNMSVEENIGIGLKIRGCKGPEIKKKIDKTIHEFSLEELRERRGHGLSGGEIQKVSLARTMVLEPKVLLLDEPFSHLDKHSRDEIIALIRSISSDQNKTIIFSTHDQFIAQTLADNICTLIDGMIMPTSLLNVFRGSVDSTHRTFTTGQLIFHLPAGIQKGNRLVIDSSDLVLSRQMLDSSMRNSFKGKIQSLSEEMGNIYLTVNAGEYFQVMITVEAWNDLNKNIGDEIWVSFKSTALQIIS